MLRNALHQASPHGRLVARDREGGRERERDLILTVEQNLSIRDPQNRNISINISLHSGICKLK